MNPGNAIPPGNPVPPVQPSPLPGGVPAPVVYMPPPQVVIQTGGSVRRFVSWLGWVGFAFCALALLGQLAAFSDYFDTSEGLQEKFHSGAEYGDQKIAIITIDGVLIDGEGYIRKQIERIKKDERIKGVVVRVNSPGGTITASDYVFHHLKKLKDEKKLPLVVSMGSIAASGGYYVAMCVGDEKNTIFAEPTTTTGSIGVMIPHYDISGLLEKLDVKDDSIATHPRKLMLSMTKPIPDDHMQLIRSYLDESLVRFKDIIKQGRPAYREDGAKLDELATGEIFSANKAQENGLIDRIGFVEDAIERVCELAGITPESARVVKYQRPFSLFDLGLDVRAPRVPRELADLVELATPRACYLATSLPPLLGTANRGRWYEP